MKTLLSIPAARIAAVLLISAASSDAFAQATVRDSQPIIPGSGTGAVSTPVTSTSVIAQSSSSNFAYQLQQLQQEVLELRGLVEEQAFQLKRLKQQRLDDYLDLDKRLAELTRANSQQSTIGQSGSSQSSIGQSDPSQVSVLSSNLPSVSNPIPSVNTEEEKKLYRKAIDQLLSQQDYQGAQGSFSQYLNSYPNGTYVPNVYYWQGQIYLTESNKSAAEKSFATLIDKYDGHQKVPDAKYKLATIYFDQGKKSQAKTLLEEVASSDTDASRLAKSFLANQFK